MTNSGGSCGAAFAMVGGWAGSGGGAEGGGPGRRPAGPESGRHAPRGRAVAVTGQCVPERAGPLRGPQRARAAGALGAVRRREGGGRSAGCPAGTRAPAGDPGPEGPAGQPGQDPGCLGPHGLGLPGAATPAPPESPGHRVLRSGAAPAGATAPAGPLADASPRPADGPGGYRAAVAEPGAPGRGRLLADQQREPDRPGAGPGLVHAAHSRASSAASPQGPLPHGLAGVLGTARRGLSDAPATPRARETPKASDEAGRIAV